MAKRRGRKRAATNAVGDHPCGKCHKPVKAVAKCEKCGANFHPGCALSYVKSNSARECCTQAFRDLGKNAKIGSPANARKVPRIRELSSSADESLSGLADSSSPPVRETRLRKTAAAV